MSGRRRPQLVVRRGPDQRAPRGHEVARREGGVGRETGPSALLTLVRILVWHGYLLNGTGSNIYTQALVREWARAGHDVTVFSQEPNPETFDLAGAEVVRPSMGRLLPVFVLDRYEGLEARLLQDFTNAERDAYV